LEGLEKIFQAIDFYYINRVQEFTKLAFGEAFPGKPDNICFRKIHQTITCIFSEGHPGPGQLQEGLLIGMDIATGFLILIIHEICLCIKCPRVVKCKTPNDYPELTYHGAIGKTRRKVKTGKAIKHSPCWITMAALHIPVSGKIC